MNRVLAWHRISLGALLAFAVLSLVAHSHPPGRTSMPTSGRAQPAPPGRVAARGDEPRVSLDLVGADVRDVLNYLADVAHLELVVGPTVGGTVTMALHEVPPQAALEEVLKRAGCEYKTLRHPVETGAHRVTPQPGQAPEPSHVGGRATAGVYAGPRQPLPGSHPSPVDGRAAGGSSGETSRPGQVPHPPKVDARAKAGAGVESPGSRHVSYPPPLDEFVTVVADRETLQRLPDDVLLSQVKAGSAGPSLPPLTSASFDADLGNVLRVVAYRLQENMLIDDSVRGVVTLSLRDVPADAAWRLALCLGNLTCRRVGPTLVVGPAGKLAGIDSRWAAIQVPSLRAPSGRIHLDWRGVGLPCVLEILARRAGWQLILDPAVRGPIDVAIKDVTAEEGLRLILAFARHDCKSLGGHVLLVADRQRLLRCPSNLLQPRKSGRISFWFNHIGLADAMHLLAARAGLSLWTDTRVQGTVDMRLNDIPAAGALELLVRLHGYHARFLNNTMVVGPAATLQQLGPDWHPARRPQYRILRARKAVARPSRPGRSRRPSGPEPVVCPPLPPPFVALIAEEGQMRAYLGLDGRLMEAREGDEVGGFTISRVSLKGRPQVVLRLPWVGFRWTAPGSIYPYYRDAASSRQADPGLPPPRPRLPAVEDDYDAPLPPLSPSTGQAQPSPSTPHRPPPFSLTGVVRCGLVSRALFASPDGLAVAGVGQQVLGYRVTSIDGPARRVTLAKNRERFVLELHSEPRP